ncbi:30S ribosomal protein S6e [Candidatus Pacearchaeota archaeon]|nr:30S ribosomal protein S6e [Candidatus Pacearchaeota archaeon]
MPFKINISEKEKSWKLEVQDESLVGKSVGDTFDGKEIKPELAGYQMQITGGSDIAGFPLSKDVEGIGLSKVLLTKGWGMRNTRPGVRMRKTVRGKNIASNTSQINIKVVKAGSKPLAEIFSDQNKPAEEKAEKAPEVSQTA